MGLLLLLGAFVAVLVLSELALGGIKLQTGLARVVVAWGVVFLAAVYPIYRAGIAPVPLLFFWGGAFLSWFGVRSHIESSILLRMLYLLRKEPLTDAQLLEKYGTYYGPALRLEELLRGGLAKDENGTWVVTPKGKNILRVVALLREREAPEPRASTQLR